MTALSFESLRAGRRLDARGRTEVLLLAALTATCAYGVHRVFGTFAATGRIVGAAIVAVLFITLLELRQVRLWLTVVLSAFAMFLYTAYTQLPETMPFGVPRAATVSGLADGFWSGWADGLDSLLPLAETGTTAALLTYLAWIAGMAAAMLLLRAEESVWPLVPPLVLFGITLPLSAPAPASALWLPFAIAVLCLSFLAFRANQRRSGDIGGGLAPGIWSEREVDVETGAEVDQPVRTAVLAHEYQPRTSPVAIARSALPVVVGCAAVGVLASVVLAFGSDTPADPREVRPDDVTPESIINPLTEFKAVRSLNPPAAALTLELLGSDIDAASLDRLPVAVLDRYDGAEWQAGAKYELSASDLAAPDLDGAVEITQTIALDQIRGPWLPAIHRPVRVSLDRVLIDRESGSLIAPLGSQIDSYTVVSRVAPAGVADLAEATVQNVDSSYVDLPSQVSADLLDLATTIASGEDNTYRRTMALVEYLQNELFVDDDAAPGHSLGRLQTFLFEERRGSPEQFAGALAVMLRTQGIPARVVIGYDLNAVPESEAGAALEITSEHYDVWVEVPFDGYGWQAFDALPAEAATEPLPEEVTGTTIPSSSEQIVAPEPQPSEATPSEAIELISDERQFGAWIFPALIAVFVLAWMLAFVALVMFSKRRRRTRRRSAPTPVGRIEGAWADAKDRLLEAGIDVPSELTLTEVALVGSEEFGDDAAHGLRALVPDVAANAYSSSEPDVLAADRAWQHADEFRSEASKARTRRKRVTEKLNPRPLVKNR